MINGVIVQNNPINGVDPLGLRTWGLIGSVNLTALLGAEGSVSVVFNPGLTPGEQLDLGIQFSGGAASGVNVGAMAGIQTYKGGVHAADGPSLNISGGVPYISGNVNMNSTGITGGSIGIGTPTRIPAAVSIGYDQTATYSVRDAISAIGNFICPPAK